MYNGEIISYSISYRTELQQVIDMLDKAFAKIPNNTQLILHCDQGWRYQHSKYQLKLKMKGIRKGCLEKAIAWIMQ